jgi:hypothetical protein
MLPPSTRDCGRDSPSEVNYCADEKLLMGNPSHEPEEQGPKKVVRIILAREVCTTPDETT